MSILTNQQIKSGVLQDVDLFNEFASMVYSFVAVWKTKEIIKLGQEESHQVLE
jgi:hypothetical protein